MFVGERFIITVRHGQTSLHEVRLQTEQRPDLLRAGPGAVLYAVVDRVVDDYVPVIAGLDQAIRHLEGDVFSASRSNPAERIYNLKREVLELHDAVTPLLDPLDDLARGSTTSSNRTCARTSVTSTTTCFAWSTRSKASATF